MKKYLYLLLLLVNILTLSNILSVNAKNITKQEIILRANYSEDFDNIDLMEHYDYAFIGQVISYRETRQYNGNGTNVPYSYFNVNVVKTFKGTLEDNIVIKFYGGYDEDNNLVLFENMNYPEVYQTYKFYCNKTNIINSNDGRTIANSFVISNPYNMFEYNIQQGGISTASITPPHFFEQEPDGGGSTNSSFETANYIDIDDSLSVYLYSGIRKYYKITTDTLNYLSIYSTGDYDCKVTIYDSERNYVTSNDDAYDRGTLFTSNSNFFKNFYADANETYYFEVSLVDSTETGTIYINLFIDNWIDSNYSSLTLSVGGVDSENKVEYRIDSKYTSQINHAINEWNKLDSVLIKPDSSGTLNNLTLSDYSDSDTDTIAYTQNRLIFASTIKFNTYKMDSFTYNEQIHTCLHELGHVLKLNEFTNVESNSNVMHQGRLSLTKLGPADIAVYRYLWG